MADKCIVKLGEVERVVFDDPAVIERYEGMGWEVVREKKASTSTRKPKTKKDGSPITHPRDLED